MTQLTKGMYGTEFRPANDLFGLRCGQMRFNDKITHNSGWYNKAGEKLGWGDLAADDFRRISNELEDGELFIVLGEQDSFWNFVTHNPGLIGSMCKTKPTEQAPGVEYVAEKARYIVAKNQLYFVDEFDTYRARGEETMVWHELPFQVLTPEEAKTLIAQFS